MMCTKERGAGEKNPTTGFFIFRVKNDHKIRRLDQRAATGPDVPDREASVFHRPDKL